MEAIKNHISFKVLITLAVTGVLGLLLAGGVVTAVSVAQTSQQVDGARATTVDIATVAVTHQGTTIASNGEAAAADTTVTPSATDATIVQRAQAVTAGDFVYQIKFESAATDDDIPAGTISLRWTTNAVEQTASLTVSVTVVGVGAKGGFTLLIPGDAANTPENIQLVYSAT